jgi:hypothetical protein
MGQIPFWGAASYSDTQEVSKNVCRFKAHYRPQDFDIGSYPGS